MYRDELEIVLAMKRFKRTFILLVNWVKYTTYFTYD